MDTHEALEKVLAEFALKPQPGEPGWEERVDEMRADLARFERNIPVIKTKNAVLTRGDIEVLEGSCNRSVRNDLAEDKEVKRLFQIWKSL